jgi:hypothetical protein
LVTLILDGSYFWIAVLVHKEASTLMLKKVEEKEEEEEEEKKKN